MIIIESVEGQTDRQRLVAGESVAARQDTYGQATTDNLPRHNDSTSRGSALRRSGDGYLKTYLLQRLVGSRACRITTTLGG
ncbi:hypothetical protein BHE74_00027322 [Ensete ventricosum]|nr:hypothetical protein BHE74_00027322 [Ensete ventricosum]